MNLSGWELHIRPVIRAGIIAALFTAPILLLIWRLVVVRRQYKSGAEDPFTELPLRPAGESLRLKIDELSERQQTQLMIRWLILAGAAMAVVSNPAAPRAFGVTLWFIVALDAAVYWPRLVKVTRDLWNHRLAFIGERAVAEELSQLLASGFHVFHDLVFENYNVDHVIVGPTGVFVVETKTRRKPKQNGKKVGYKVGYDGTALFWPKARETKSVEQSLANARSVSKWLSSATGAPVSVQPVVTAPGWWIDDATQHSVWALNPKRIRPHVEAHKSSPLSNQRVASICYQLTEKCRLRKDQ